MSFEIMITIGVSSMLITLFIVYKVSSSRRQEREKVRTGLESMNLIKQVIVLAQQHRGVSNAYRQGNVSLKVKLTTLQAELDHLIIAGGINKLTLFPQWESFIEHWPRLKNYVFNDQADIQNMVRQHNLMIDGHLSLFDDVTRYYNLHSIMLDSVTRVSELCLDTLRTAETVGQARAVGAGICAKGLSNGVDAIVLNFLRLSLDSSVKELCAVLLTIQNEELSSALTRSSQGMAKASEELLDVIESKILVEGAVTFDSKKYFDLATSSIDELLTVFTAVERYSLRHFSVES